MAAYRQWLKGVRRRAAVRSRYWRWVEDAVAGASGKRVGGIVAALATAVVLGAGLALAAKRAAACQASERSIAAAQWHLIAAHRPLPNLAPQAARTRLSCAAEGRGRAEASVTAGARLEL